MFPRTVGLVLTLATALFAAHDQLGTWKLDVAKSTYTGMPKPREMTVVYSPAGTGWNYKATGMREDGQAINSSFTYVKDGEVIKTTGFPMWDSLVLNNAGADVATGTMMRGGKKVGTVKRTMSADGKTMTISGDGMGPDGKKVSYKSIYIKQ